MTQHGSATVALCFAKRIPLRRAPRPSGKSAGGNKKQFLIGETPEKAHGIGMLNSATPAWHAPNPKNTPNCG